MPGKQLLMRVNYKPSDGKGVEPSHPPAPPQQVFPVFPENEKSFYSKQNF